MKTISKIWTVFIVFSNNTISKHKSGLNCVRARLIHVNLCSSNDSRRNFISDMCPEIVFVDFLFSAVLIW